jgi:hypothetical protein
LMSAYRRAGSLDVVKGYTGVSLPAGAIGIDLIIVANYRET